jgi:hypothetical protein
MAVPVHDERHCSSSFGGKSSERAWITVSL